MGSCQGKSSAAGTKSSASSSFADCPVAKSPAASSTEDGERPDMVSGEAGIAAASHKHRSKEAGGCTPPKSSLRKKRRHGEAKAERGRLQVSWSDPVSDSVEDSSDASSPSGEAAGSRNKAPRGHSSGRRQNGGSDELRRTHTDESRSARYGSEATAGRLGRVSRRLSSVMAKQEAMKAQWEATASQMQDGSKSEPPTTNLGNYIKTPACSSGTSFSGSGSGGSRGSGSDSLDASSSEEDPRTRPRARAGARGQRRVRSSRQGLGRASGILQQLWADLPRQQAGEEASSANDVVSL